MFKDDVVRIGLYSCSYDVLRRLKMFCSANILSILLTLVLWGWRLFICLFHTKIDSKVDKEVDIKLKIDTNVDIKVDSKVNKKRKQRTLKRQLL